MIEGLGLTIGYETKNVVSEFNIAAKQGEVVSLIGPNGSGKSTVLKVLSRMMKSSGGVVRLDGHDIHKLPTREVAKKLSMLSQTHTSPPDFTVRELVSYGRMPHQSWFEAINKEDQEIIEWAISKTRLEHLADRSVNSLSGGERQRAWIALALAQKPKILLLDEPTTFLDICHQIEIMELVKALNQELGITVVMVLHDLNQAAAYSHRLVVIKDGQLVTEGEPAQVLTSDLMRKVYNVEAEIACHPQTGKLFFHALGLCACGIERGRRDGTSK
jgi:iron complex transport system ATP-binding protein